MATATLAHYAEYAALRGLLGALAALSFERAGAIGERLGALGYRPFGIRRAVVERQIAAAFPELAPTDVARIARASYRHLGRTTVEAAVLPTFGRERVLSLFEGADGWHLIEEAQAAGKGILFVTGHLGNWELAGSYVAARVERLHAVARHMANPLFDAYLTRTRERLGMRVVHDEQAVRQVPRAVRDNRAVAMLIDQGAVGLASTWVPFFGRMAKTPRGPAVFSLRLGAPLIFGCALRQPSGKYRLAFERVEVERTGETEADVDRIVAAYSETLERWVRKAPEQYFWHHRRWKHQRPGTPPEIGDPS